MSETRIVTKDEIELLLYLESAAVDLAGGLDGADRFNLRWTRLLSEWADEGFIRFGRIAAEDRGLWGSHWVELSDEAFAIAHRLRRERAGRADRRHYRRAEDLKGDSV